MIMATGGLFLFGGVLMFFDRSMYILNPASLCIDYYADKNHKGSQWATLVPPVC